MTGPGGIFEGFGGILLKVTVAVLPLLFLFLIMQLIVKLPRTNIRSIITGFALTFCGLALFLQGVEIGFLPAGRAMGSILGSLPHRWILIPVGFVLGFVAILAEPAVRILSTQVESASSGYIRSGIILYTLSLSVAFFTALAMTRVLYGIPIHYIVVPGYVLAIVMLKYAHPTFISIAFDSGGVATGPMTATILLAVAVGAASVIEGRDPVIDGFGLAALVALAPILLVMVLGFFYRYEDEKSDEDVGQDSCESE